MGGALRSTRGVVLALIAGLLCTASVTAQGTVTAKLQPSNIAAKSGLERAAVLWLEPLNSGNAAHTPWPVPPPYRMLQKRKMFSPHLLVIPVGSTVSFPNADPFFHNVFSLFDGKRFDLGLYEAGQTREIRFERAGISYLFCNIHPEMSAVILALHTPFWATADKAGTLHINNVPAGEYEAHIWLEGEDGRTLSAWTHRLAVGGSGVVDAGIYHAKFQAQPGHLNKFGEPYKPEPAAY